MIRDPFGDPAGNPMEAARRGARPALIKRFYKQASTGAIVWANTTDVSAVVTTTAAAAIAIRRRIVASSRNMAAPLNIGVPHSRISPYSSGASTIGS